MKENGQMGLDKVHIKRGKECRVYHQQRRIEGTVKDTQVKKVERGKRGRVWVCVCAGNNNLQRRYRLMETEGWESRMSK